METITNSDYYLIAEALEILHDRERKGYEKLKYKLRANGQIKRSKVERLESLTALIKRGLR
jgi:hypothetical protein